MPLGQQGLYTGGRGYGASVDGVHEAKVAGITIDWTVVPTNVPGITLNDGTVIPAGVKYIPAGCFLAMITASRKYGPHDPVTPAADGRQTPTRGRLFIINRHLLETDEEHEQFGVDIIEGGRVYGARLKVQASASTYAAPSAGQLSAAIAVMPRLVVVVGNE